MQYTPRMYVLAATLALLAAILVGCGSDSEPTTTTSAGNETHSEFPYGDPADPADADRTIDVVATAGLRWEPETIGVEAGETVTFRITNESDVVHDFTLGDEEAQEEHEAEMAAMDDDMMMMDEPNALAIEPGETRELTWTFTEPGKVLIACHEPGHYEAGMISEILVVE